MAANKQRNDWIPDHLRNDTPINDTSCTIPMLKKQAQVFLSLLFVTDLCIVLFSWNIAYFLRFFWVQFPTPSGIPEYYIYFRAGWVVVLIAAFCFIYSKMYTPKRISSYRAEVRSILNSNILLVIILLGLTFYFRKYSFSRLHSVLFFGINAGIIFTFRFIIRYVLNSLRKKGKNLRRILVIGNSKVAMAFMKKVYKNEALGFKICGYVAKSESQLELKSDYLGDYEQLSGIIEKEDIDQIYVALDSNQQSDLQEINEHLAEQMVDLNIVPDIYHTLNINPEILDLDGMPIIALRQSPIDGWNRIFKRIFDIMGSIGCILMATPLWIVIPVLIKLSSRGPVFYRQERMGLDGKSFHMIKFRSMRIDAEDQTGAVWAVQNDNRKTAIGSFLRKTSLDEIPQFFNVLEGSMSLVGPRPERPVFIHEFKKEIPNYMLRHKMKAGITGWAQINGWRGNTSLEKRIECDIYYLTHWSIWFDIKILIGTVFKGFIHKNAY